MEEIKSNINGKGLSIMRVSTKKLIALIKENEAVQVMNHGQNYTMSVKVSKAQAIRDIKYIEESNDTPPIWDIDVFPSKEIHIN